MSYDEICMVSVWAATRPCGFFASSNKLDSSSGRGKWPWGHRERIAHGARASRGGCPWIPSVSASPRGGGRACACTDGRKAGGPSRGGGGQAAGQGGRTCAFAGGGEGLVYSHRPAATTRRWVAGGAEDLVDWPDAPEELKARIIRLHRRLRQLSAWDLLGVEKDAANPTIKRAFGVASKELHPDRYFGKNLGSFKAKLAAIFNRVSEAVQEIERSRKDKD